MTMTDIEKFTGLLGKRILAIRKEMKLKRVDFARLVGMSEDAIGLIERGDAAPRIDSLYKIAANLNMPLPKLLDLGDDIAPKGEKSNGSALSSLNLYLKTKSPEQVQMIRDVAHNIFSRCGGMAHCVHKPDKSRTEARPPARTSDGSAV